MTDQQPAIPALDDHRALAVTVDGAFVDPAAGTRQAQLLRLRAAAPMRGRSGQHSRDITGLPMFQGDLLL